MDLYLELKRLLAELERRQVPYALAGGLALAVHGIARATEDIDLLVEADDLSAAEAVGRDLGFTLASDLAFGSGLFIRRLAKVVGDEVLVLDLLRVDEGSRTTFQERLRARLDDLEVAVVSRSGLERMKLAAGRAQDLADLARLREMDG